MNNTEDIPWDWNCISYNISFFKLSKQETNLVVRQYFAKKTIWRAWFRAITNPEYLLCHKRLLNEITVLKN
jgi:hypothetical protein